MRYNRHRVNEDIQWFRYSPCQTVSFSYLCICRFWIEHKEWPRWWWWWRWMRLPWQPQTKFLDSTVVSQTRWTIRIQGKLARESRSEKYKLVQVAEICWTAFLLPWSLATCRELYSFVPVPVMGVYFLGLSRKGGGVWKLRKKNLGKIRKDLE